MYRSFQFDRDNYTAGAPVASPAFDEYPADEVPPTSHYSPTTANPCRSRSVAPLPPHNNSDHPPPEPGAHPPRQPSVVAGVPCQRCPGAALSLTVFERWWQAEAARRQTDDGPVVLNDMDNRERERCVVGTEVGGEPSYSTGIWIS